MFDGDKYRSPLRDLPIIAPRAAAGLKPEQLRIRETAKAIEFYFRDPFFLNLLAHLCFLFGAGVKSDKVVNIDFEFRRQSKEFIDPPDV
jgi:hypothetical protein